ncbi:hypothetical protein, partial [uncultured Prevotella sp.]|uniref:hypothetical protein n=1 Tax=uncultured Prevotella sp. TaxID=159272 RepID=UPI00262C12E9
MKLIGHLFQLASTYNKNHIHLLILCIGYSRRNCIKIQLAEPQEDIQDTDKLVLPTLEGTEKVPVFEKSGFIQLSISG